MGILDDKHCIITGGAGSVGLASAKAMAEEGARIMLVDRDMAALEQAADSIGAKDTLIAAADISDSTQVQAFVKQAAENWGKIDVVFANAGISGTNASVADFPEDVFDDVMDINVRGTFLTLKHAIPHMRDGGSIVVTSSIMGGSHTPRYGGLYHLKTRADRHGALRGARIGGPEHPRQHHRARTAGERVSANHRRSGQRSHGRQRHRDAQQHDPAGTPWHRRGDIPRRSVFGIRPE